MPPGIGPPANVDELSYERRIFRFGHAVRLHQEPLGLAVKQFQKCPDTLRIMRISNGKPAS